MAAHSFLQRSHPKKKNILLIIFIGRYWFQIVLLLFAIYFIRSKDMKVSVNIGAEEPKAGFISLDSKMPEKQPEVSEKEVEFSVAAIAGGIEGFLEDKPAALPGKWKSSDFRNLTFIFDKGYAAKKGVEKWIVDEKLKICRDYVERFAPTAVAEMEKFGIPASITLAQGLLETDAGGSKLASESNNHFGIKCRSKCRGCTCRNYSDDDVYDMFRVFNTAWESFREHSKLLSNTRYQHLKKLGTKDYKGWASGLSKAGYATDKNYDKKLEKIIEALDLHKYDK